MIFVKNCFPTRGKASGAERNHTMRDGNLYPSHGLGPVANYMGYAARRSFRIHCVDELSPARPRSISQGSSAAREIPGSKRDILPAT